MKIKCQDYTISLDEFISENFIYFDPPYPKVKSTSFSSYGKHVFDDEKFYEKLNHINKICFLCSYSYTEKIKQDNFVVIEITVSRNINSNAKGRKGAKETFFMNYFFVDIRRDLPDFDSQVVTA